MANDLPTGSVFAGYRIEGIAGRGGMGVVYRATQIALDRAVALKLITPDLADDVDFRERFKRESMTAAQIEHPNVIPVYEAGEADDRLFITMRFIHGTDLRELIRSVGRLDPGRAVGIICQIAAALDAAHRRGLVHRDVKPANILISGDEDEHAYLTDFGLTKSSASVAGLTRTGQFVGTPDYAAPEQIKGERADGRADVYALGCVLFHALTGEVPYLRDSEIAKIYAHLSAPPPSVTEMVRDAPAGFDGVIRRALAKEADERYASAGDLGRAAMGAVSGAAAPVLDSPRSVATGAAAPAPPTPTGLTRPFEGATPPAPEAEPATAAAPTEAAPTEMAAAVSTEAPATERLDRSEAVPPPRPPAGGPGGRRGRGGLVAAAAAGALVLVVAVVAVSGVFGGSDDGGGGSSGAEDSSSGAGNASGPRVAATIEAGSGPDGLSVNDGVVWVTDQEENVLRRFDSETNEQIGEAIHVGQNPDGVAAEGGVVWVANSDEGTVTRLEVDGDEVTETGHTEVGGRPEGVSLGKNVVWVTTGPVGTVTNVDRASAEEGDPIQTGSNTIGVYDGDTAVWVSDKVRETVSRIDPDSGSVVGKPIKVGPLPRGLIEAEGSVWVANSGDGTVSRIDASDGRVVGDAIRVGENPRDVTFLDGFIWVANTDSNSVSRIDASSGKVVGKPIKVGEKPASIMAGAGSVWVSNSGEGTLSRISPR